jgi:hypothetical protein
LDGAHHALGGRIRDVLELLREGCGDRPTQPWSNGPSGIDRPLSRIEDETECRRVTKRDADHDVMPE